MAGYYRHFKLTVGTTKDDLSEIEKQALEWLIAQGAKHQKIELPNRFPESAMTVMLNVEAATVFDDILRSQPDADLGLWPIHSARANTYQLFNTYVPVDCARNW